MTRHFAAFIRGRPHHLGSSTFPTAALAERGARRYNHSRRFLQRPSKKSFVDIIAYASYIIHLFAGAL